jgi:putative CRISPR-associated protein (TIGR02619 family)
MTTLITTVGTSLLTNRDDRPWAGWRPGQPLPNESDVQAWLSVTEPARISAEVHTWFRLGLLGPGPDARVVLVHSDTEDGHYCARQLHRFAGQRGIAGRIVPVQGLRYQDPASFGRGLGTLVRVVAEAIREGRLQGDVAIAATGGFKAEIAVANLVGALLQTPVHYIYEQFTELITLPPLPVALASAWLTEGAARALLDRLDAAGGMLRHSDAAPLLRADERLEMLLESEDVDGERFVSTNVLGELAVQLRAAPRAEWPEPTTESPERKNHMAEDEHHRPGEWRRVVGQLCRSGYVTSVRHDPLGCRAVRKVLPAPDNETDVLAAIGDRNAPLGLRIGTTARTNGQRSLVQQHLQRLVFGRQV